MWNSGWLRSGIIWLIAFVAVTIIFAGLYSPPDTAEPLDITAVASEIKQGKVERLVVAGNTVRVIRHEGREVVSYKESSTSIAETLRNLGVTPAELEKITIEVKEPSPWGNWGPLLSGFLPLVFLGALIFFMMRQAQASGNQALSFGRSRARLFTGDKPTVTFADVAGVDEAKEELQEVVEFLKEPGKFAALGARIPKGVLMVGPPGCGKTLMARAVAGEAGVPFFSISGSEFVEMFVGVGASRVRDLFDQAKKHAPCIVFVDEIDAVGRHRGAGLGGSHDEREQTLNQILVEMDGFDTDTNVIVIAATNRPDILDPALLRPGRFDRRVVLDRPDLNGRRAILEIHVRGKPLAPEVNLDAIARQTPGFSGADIENLVNEAAILAARRNKKTIGNREFQEAVEKVIAGPERKSRVISEEEREIIAYHETGHALVRAHLPHCDPVHKISIISRGMTLGYVMKLPTEDHNLYRRTKFEDELAAILGGRAAEEVVFADVTDGAMDDLEQATKLARAMVTQYGMSERLGPMTFGEKTELVFLGKEIGEQRNYSEAVAQEIDAEVKRIVNRAYERAKQILTAHRDKLEVIARRLIEQETLDAEEFKALLAESVEVAA